MPKQPKSKPTILNFYDFKPEHEIYLRNKQSKHQVTLKCLYCDTNVSDTLCGLSNWANHIKKYHANEYIDYQERIRLSIKKMEDKGKLILEFYDFRPEEHGMYLKKSLRQRWFHLKCLDCEKMVKSSIGRKCAWIMHLKKHHEDTYKSYLHKKMMIDGEKEGEGAMEHGDEEEEEDDEEVNEEESSCNQRHSNESVHVKSEINNNNMSTNFNQKVKDESNEDVATTSALKINIGQLRREKEKEAECLRKDQQFNRLKENFKKMGADLKAERIKTNQIQLANQILRQQVINLANQVNELKNNQRSQINLHRAKLRELEESKNLVNDLKERIQNILANLLASELMKDQYETEIKDLKAKLAQATLFKNEQIQSNAISLKALDNDELERLKIRQPQFETNLVNEMQSENLNVISVSLLNDSDMFDTFSKSDLDNENEMQNMYEYDLVGSFQSKDDSYVLMDKEDIEETNEEVVDRDRGNEINKTEIDEEDERDEKKKCQDEMNKDKDFICMKEIIQSM